MKYQYVIFDMDGTLLDTKKALMVSIEKGLEEFDLKKQYLGEELENNWGGDVLKQLVEFIDTNSQKHLERDQIIKKLTKHYTEETWNIFVKPFKGIREMLERLKMSGISLNVYSNSPDYIAKSLIEYFFPGIFDIVLGLTDQIKKPDADILKHLFVKYHLDPFKVLMVGDTMTDYVTALNGEIDFAGAAWDDSLQVKKMINHVMVERKFYTPEQLTDYILQL